MLFRSYKKIVDGLQNRAETLVLDKKIWDSMKSNTNAMKETWLVYFLGKFSRFMYSKVYYKNVLRLCNITMFRGKFKNGGILFCFQCQPERSSNPCGGVKYHNQIELLKEISEIIGPDELIYVKEHPSQYSSYQFPEQGRSLKFYRDLAKIRNAVPIPALPTAEELIKGASCVITLGGTAAWSAIKNGVPAIVCGQTGYAACTSAMPGRNREELKSSLGKILGCHQARKEIIDSALDFDEIMAAFMLSCRSFASWWTPVSWRSEEHTSELQSH